MSAPQTYRTLLRLYPADYRARFAAEMQNTFEHALEERRLRDRQVWMRFLTAEFLSLLKGAAADWIAKWTTDRVVRGRSLPDVRMMRPPGITREVWFDRC